MADSRPIPTPNDEQLEGLTNLTNHAHRRAQARNGIDEKIKEIVGEKEAIMARHPYWYNTHRVQLANMDRELAFLDGELDNLQTEDETDAVKEWETWKQVIWGYTEGGTGIGNLILLHLSYN